MAKIGSTRTVAPLTRKIWLTKVAENFAGPAGRSYLATFFFCAYGWLDFSTDDFGRFQGQNVQNTRPPKMCRATDDIFLPAPDPPAHPPCLISV